MACSDLLLMSLGSAFLIGFLYMIVLRIAGGPIIYLSILAMILGTAYGAYMLYDMTEAMDPNDEYYQYYNIGTYVVAGFAALLLLCALCN